MTDVYKWMRWSALLLLGVSAVVSGFERQSFPANNSHATTFSVTAPARYRLQVVSPTGTQLRLVSRVTGPGLWKGLAGETDGTQDQFLDVGEYRVDLRGNPKARGKAELKLSRFVELHTEPRPLSKGLTETSLGDLEQRTYTFRVAEAGPFFVEAAGRALSGLALRNERGWLLHEVEPTETRTPVTGQPVRIATMALHLDAGTYELSAFGGKHLAWAKGGDTSPLFVRRGIEVLAPDHSARHETSPFGVDRFLVPAFASFARMELPASTVATLRAQPFDGRSLFELTGQQVEITERQRVPIARVGLSRHGITRLDALAGTHFAALPVDQALRRFWRPLALATVSQVPYHLVTVSMAAGLAYSLQFATDERRVLVKRSGRYFIEVAPAGDVRDSAAVTALAFAGPKQESRHSLVQSNAINMRSTTSVRGQFNLSNRAEFFLRVHESGRYRLSGGGISATYEVKPYGTTDATAVRTFPSSSSEAIVLERGFYRLTLSAPRGGLHQLKIQGPRARARNFQWLRSVARFADLVVPSGHEGVIGVAAATSELGVAVRALPIDLRVPMSMVLEPGQSLQVPVRMLNAANIYLNHDGIRGDFVLQSAGQASSRTLRLTAGEQVLTIVSTDVVPRRVTLVMSQPQAYLTLPTKKDTVLTTGVPVAINLAAKTPREAWLDIPTSGTYRIETTGLLATAAALSSRNTLGLVSGTSNGTGRNFRLMRWLPKGRWRLGFRALGRSAGGTQLSAARASVLAREELEAGAAAARVMSPGESWPISLRIAEAGEYDLRVMTLSGTLPIDLRDGKGWPVLTPGHTLDVPVTLAAGRYELLVHAPRNPGQVVVELDAAVVAASYQGHGPHHLGLGRRVKHRWNVGQPDIWEFYLSAAAQFAIRVSPGMVGHLVGPQGRELKVTGELTTLAGNAGRYQLHLAHSRDDNRHDYRLSIISSSLLPGQRRSLKLPATLQVAVPASGFVRLRSTGNSDVRASLTDARGHELARSDDTGANWNFDLRVMTRNPKLTLNLWPVGKASGRTVLHHVGVTSEQSQALKNALTAVPSTKALKLPRGQVTLVTMPGVDGRIIAPLRPAREAGRLVFANAEVERSLTVPASLDISRHNFEAPAMARGDVPVLLPRGQARRIALPYAHKRVTLDLARGVYALLGTDTVGGDRPARWTVDTDAKTLYLINPLTVPGYAAVLVDPLVDDAHGASVLNSPSAGYWRPTERWQNAFRNNAPLAITGSASESVGSVSSGVLEVSHDAGLVSLWDLNTLKSRAIGAVSMTVRDLEQGARLAGATAIALSESMTGFYLLRSDAPVAWFRERAGRVQAGVLTAGMMHLATPAPSSSIKSVAQTDYLRLLPLFNSAMVQLRSVAPAALGEGLSDARWLSPKAQVLFRFELGESKRVGIGAKGTHGDARIYLMRAADALASRPPPLAAWPQTLERNLAAGKYILRIANPMSVPQSIRTALAGLGLPTSVPADIVRRYMLGLKP